MYVNHILNIDHIVRDRLLEMIANNGVEQNGEASYKSRFTCTAEICCLLLSDINS